MNNFPALLAYLLASMGLAIIIVWPETGPGSWLRERLLRPLIPARFTGVLDCYICAGFWSGLILSAIWYHFYRDLLLFTGGLMVAALFWIFLGVGRSR